MQIFRLVQQLQHEMSALLLVEIFEILMTDDSCLFKTVVTKSTTRANMHVTPMVTPGGTQKAQRGFEPPAGDRAG